MGPMRAGRKLSGGRSLRRVGAVAPLLYCCAMRRLVLLVPLLAVLAACAGALDGEQLRLCRRVLPALHPDTTQLREIAAVRAPLGRQGVRIEYTAREPGGDTRVLHVACGFGGRTLEPARLELVAVETDEGPLGEARLLYLQRFWLADPTAIAESARPSGLIELPERIAYAAQQLINALALGAIYALLATAYSLIYGLIGRINLAFGQIAVVGAFGATSIFAGAVAYGLANPLAGLALMLAIAAGLAGVWSWSIGKLVVAPLHEWHRFGQPILVATVAVAITLEELLRVSQGARERWMPPVFNEPLPLAASGAFIVTATWIQTAVAAIALAAAGTVLWLLACTAFGRRWRAFADDPQAAALLGIAPGRLVGGTFFIAGALAGLSGWIVAVYYGNVSFTMGTMLGLKALVAAVVGGIGSVPGAFLGGILVGLLEALWSAYFDIALRDTVVYAMLIVVFVLRPGGLLGFSGPSPRQV
jgi:branched-chain amino acid transport system permease protein